MGILNGPSSFEEPIYTRDIISFLEPEDLVNFSNIESEERINIDDNYLSSLFNNQEKDLIDVMEKGNFEGTTNLSSIVTLKETNVSNFPNLPVDKKKPKKLSKSPPTNLLQQKRQREPNTSISSNSPVGTKKFKVIYPEPKKRNHIYKERYKRADLIKIKIVTHFFNVYLIRRSTEEIRKAGSIDNFKIFPIKFIEKVTKKENKKIWEKTLEDIFNNKDSEFYESRFEKNYNIIKKPRERR